MKKICTSGPGATMLPLNGQRSAKNQQVLKDWARSKYRSFMASGGEVRLGDLQCKGTLFNLGHDSRFNTVISETRTYADDHRIFVADRGFRYNRILPTGDYEANTYTVRTALTIPRQGPVIFLADDLPTEDTLWHEFQHVLLFAEFPGEGVYARDLGPRFVQSLWRPNVAGDDEGHHLFIEGYAERGLAAYAKLKNFEKTLLSLAEGEYQADQRGTPLTDQEREQLYQPASADYEAFLNDWDRVAPFEGDPNAAPYLYRYQKATGVWFKPPAEVEDYYRKGNLKLPKPTGPYPVFVPESVFKPSQLLKQIRIDTRLEDGEEGKNQFSRKCRIQLMQAVPGAAGPRAITGQQGTWGSLEIELENPEENYTFLKLEQSGKVLPGVASPGLPGGSPHRIQADVTDKGLFTLTFSHGAVDRSKQKEPFKVTIRYRDSRRPATYDPAEALVLFPLPEPFQADLTLYGDREAPSGKPIVLTVKAHFRIDPAPPVTFTWKDQTDGRELKPGDTIRFSSTTPGDHELEVVASTADGRVAGRTTHTIKVLGASELTIKGPSQTLRAEVFTLEAVVPPELKAQRFFWYALEAGKKRLLYRLPGLIAVPELAEPWDGIPPWLSQDDPATDRVLKLQDDGSRKEMTYVVEARGDGDRQLATSKPHKVTMKPGYFEMKIPTGWSKVDKPTGSSLERKGGEYGAYLSLKWVSEGGQRPTLDDGQTTPGPDGFRRKVSRFVKGKTGIYDEVVLPDPPQDPKKKAAYEAFINKAKSEIEAMLASLKIVDHPTGSQASQDQVRIRLQADKTELAAGEAMEVQVVVEGATGPFQYEWTGNHEGHGDRVRFLATKPGPYSLKVSVSDNTGNLGAASLTFQVKGVTVSLKRTGTGPVVVGRPIELEAALVPANTKATLRWQPLEEVNFTPVEGTSTRAVFQKPGKVRLWVSAHEPKSGETLAESQPLELEVVPPELAIQLEPASPLVGQEVKATVVAAVEEADYRWTVSEGGTLLNEGDGEITFYAKVTTPVTVQVLVRSQSEDLGAAEARLSARPYQVSATLVKPQGGVPAGQPAQLLAGIQPAPPKPPGYRWSVNPGSSVVGVDISREVTVSREEAGMIEAAVIASDPRGFELGRATVTVPVTASPADGFLQKARQLAAQGRFDEAVQAANQAAVTDPAGAAEVKKEIAAQALDAGKQSIENEDFQKATAPLQVARSLEPGNQAIQEALKQAADFESRHRTIDRLIGDLESLVEARQVRTAHQKMYEISQVQNDGKSFPKGQHPRWDYAQALLNDLIKQYNLYWSDLRQRRTALFQAGDYAGLVELCKTALNEWEHTEPNEHDLRTSIRDYGKLAGEQQSKEQALVGCKSNLKKIGTALKIWSTDHQGRYPDKLSRLAPDYLKVLPTCPAASKDTYSARYESSQNPDDYVVFCTGDHHAPGTNLPAYSCNQGLCTEAPVRRADGSDAMKPRPGEALSDLRDQLDNIENQLDPASAHLSAEVQPGSGSVPAGGQTQTAAQASGGHPPYRFEWYIGNERTGDSGQNKTWKLNQPGTYPLRVVVTDAAGQSAEATCSMTVTGSSQGLSVRVDPPSHRLPPGGADADRRPGQRRRPPLPLRVDGGQRADRRGQSGQGVDPQSAGDVRPGGGGHRRHRPKRPSHLPRHRERT